MPGDLRAIELFEALRRLERKGIITLGTPGTGEETIQFFRLEEETQIEVILEDPIDSEIENPIKRTRCRNCGRVHIDNFCPRIGRRKNFKYEK